MIDEEEDEDILEKKTSWKTILKHVVVIALMILGILFIYFGFGLDQTQGWFIGFMFICLATTLLQVQKKPEEPKKQTLTILECEACDLKTVRDYKEGDYVYKEIGKCNECDDILKITQIYSVKLKGEKAKKKLESVKRPEPTPLSP
jgi:hypothetical protein